ncbi:MAG: universal stress protein [Armatimonadota bacterium]
MEQLRFAPRRILAPIDFSELSLLALKYAAVGSVQFGAELLVLHAEHFEVPPYIIADEYDRILKELTQQRQNVETYLAEHVRKTLGPVADRLTIRYIVADSHPVEAILQTADTEGVDLIVMGTHGRTGLQRFYLGSVTERVLREVTIPVFVVKQKEKEFINVNAPEAEPRLGKILCPVNFTPTARLALMHAVAIAARFNSQLTALYIDEREELDEKQARERICQWIPEEVAAYCSVEPMVKSGNAAEQIVALARDGNYDLLVFGAERRSFLRAILFGTTTETLLRSSPIPMLVVPNGR